MSVEEEPVWMARARREIGVKEVMGPGDHPRIVEYLATTKIGPRFHHDATPHCSAFACWVMEGTDIASTRSAAAISWETWGKALDTPKPGAIVVYMRKSVDNPRARHVGFFVGLDRNGHWLTLGANQGNAVCIRPYDPARVTAIRWPDV